jgi:hypothetical protein
MYTCNRTFLGCSLTESTSAKSVGRFRRWSGSDRRTSDRDRIDVHIRMTSFSASRNSSTFLKDYKLGISGYMNIYDYEFAKEFPSNFVFT